MTRPPSQQTGQPTGADVSRQASLRKPAEILEERWVVVAAFLTLALYVCMVLITPSGEGWGRGWNLIAFMIYSIPTALAAGFVALWRVSKTERAARTAARWTAAAALAFPIICMIVLRMKAAAP